MHRILLLGSGDFVRGVLDGLLASEHRVIGFFPWEIRDKPSLKKRLKRFFIPNNLDFAATLDIPLLHFTSANSAEFIDAVGKLAPDIIMVAGWGEILKPATIALPKIACINVHPSLLPRHRGANPIASVLREGESSTGVSFHYLTAQIDAGNILYQSEIPVYAWDDYQSLARRIAFRAKETVGFALKNLDRQGFAQDETLATYYHRLARHDTFLDWSQPAEKIRNLVRSTGQGNYFRSLHQGVELKIISAELVDLHCDLHEWGVVIDKSGSQLLISTGDPGKALFVQAAPANGKLGALSGKYYCRKKIRIGDRLSSR